MAEINKNINEEVETKSKKSAEKKPNIFVRFGKKVAKICKDTVGELKKVVWTSKSDVWKSFKLVIAKVVVISLIIGIIDVTSSFIINTIAGLIG